ncbi:MAG: sugar phosphate isomerase/epimerase family protein [Armatimonadota bacterium]
MAKGIVGAQMYTVRDFCKTLPDIEESCKKVAEIGYTSVQISGFGPADPKDVARIMEDCGLTVASTHTAWPRFREDLDGVIEEHKLYKCAHPAVGGVPPHYRSLDGLKQLLDELAPIAEGLAAEGMDFSYHNHNQELVKCGDRTWLAMLYEDGSPDVVKAEIDTYWIQAGGGDPAEWVRKCAGREPLLHLKDMCMTAEREQRFAEVGEGNLNWPAIMEAAEAGGVEYYLVEQDQCYDRDPFESLAISYRNLAAMGLS